MKVSKKSDRSYQINLSDKELEVIMITLHLMSNVQVRPGLPDIFSIKNIISQVFQIPAYVISVSIEDKFSDTKNENTHEKS